MFYMWACVMEQFHASKPVYTTTENLYGPVPRGGGLVLSGSVPFIMVPGQFTPFQNRSGP